MKENKEIQSRIPEKDKQAFIKDYMMFRDQGYSRKQSHNKARELASIQGRQAPHYATLLCWIRNGNAYTVKQKTENKIEQTDNIPECEEKEIADSVTALRIAKALLSLYRKRDKNAVDKICDMLTPAIGGLE